MEILAAMSKEEHGKLGDDSAIKDFYVERDDRFILDVKSVDGYELGQNSKLKSALEKERGNAEAERRKNSAFEGLDPKAARDAIAKVAEMKDWDPDKKIEEGIKARETQLISAHADEKTKWEKDTSKLMGYLNDSLIKAEAVEAINELEGSVTLLMPWIEKQTRLKHTEGKGFEPEVVNEEGHGRIAGSDGKPMSVHQLVEEMKGMKKYAGAFKGTGHSGSGAQGSADGHQGGSGHSISRAFNISNR